MRPKMQKIFSLKLLVSILFLLFVLYWVMSPSSFRLQQQALSVPSTPPSCTKLPPSLADAILHYATLNTTPQQTIDEISVAARVLREKSPCNFLVFGLGHDSLMWSALNHGGRTVFLEEDEAWIEAWRLRRLPVVAETYHVKYDTRVSEAEQLLELGARADCKAVGDLRRSGCRLALKQLPPVFYEVEWDLIMVDAPTGYHAGAPGRMAAIYTAGMAARWRKEGKTEVFVHDVDRAVEDRFSKAFLCEGYMKHEEGRLRHFSIPSHRANTERPFCPP
ncbi:unnamed protein product [Musa banksii]